VTSSGPVAYALAGLDIALWDLRGKALGRPVHALLGGAKVESLPAYASLMRYAQVDAVAAECAEALRRGYVAVKVHETGLEAIRAAAAVAASRSSVLMVDVNCPWPLHVATAFARALEALAIHWLEEPIWPPENYHALAALRTRTRIPLAAGENALSVGDFERMLDACGRPCRHYQDRRHIRMQDRGEGCSCNIALARRFRARPAYLIHLRGGRRIDVCSTTCRMDLRGRREAAQQALHGLRLPRLGADPDRTCCSMPHAPGDEISQ
jgi:hypothetical protein